MGYTLQAIVGKEGVLDPVVKQEQTVRLTQEILLLPLTDRFRAMHGNIPFLPFTDDGLDVIPESLAALCDELSALGRIAYLEAEFFGGQGTQAIVLAAHGRIVRGPEVRAHAINEGLAFVGVAKKADLDRFDTLGLGQYRSTEHWLKSSR